MAELGVYGAASNFVRNFSTETGAGDGGEIHVGHFVVNSFELLGYDSGS